MNIINGDPVWIDGDVVRIRFARKRDRNTDGLLLSDEYTYTRQDGYWPGEAEWSSHTDEEMTAAWRESRLAAMVMTSVNEPATGDGGAWTVYNDYGSEGYRNIALFDDELKARRWADQDPHSAQIVAFLGWGEVLP